MKNLFLKLVNKYKNWDTSNDKKWDERNREQENTEAIHQINVVPSSTDGKKYAVIIGNDVVCEYENADDALSSVDFIRKKYIERRMSKKRTIWY